MAHLVTRKKNTPKRTNSLLRQAVVYPLFQSALDFRRNGPDSFLEQRLSFWNPLLTLNGLPTSMDTVTYKLKDAIFSYPSLETGAL